MGYTTDFFGEFSVNPPLSPEQVAYLNAFSSTRRMKRDPLKAALLNDPKRVAVRLDIGPEGAFFVGNEADFGQARDASVLDYNRPPKGQPGLWCQWVPSDDGAAIRWDGGEKFYGYVEWIEYLVAHFLKPWSRALYGTVSWQGEERNDRGTIRAHGARIAALQDAIRRPH